MNAPEYRREDRLMVGLALAHGALLIVWPTWWLIAVGLWWNSNTISHHFVHRHFFRSAAANRIFSIYQSLLLGIPQGLWRERHLAHHAGRPVRRPLRGIGRAECGAVVVFIGIVAAWKPEFMLQTYFPGYLLGLVLCQVHGYFEHSGGVTSYYGRLYNCIFFNDGYHVEHHANPRVLWSELPLRRARSARVSAWPAVLRWMEWINLDHLEMALLHLRPLQPLVLGCHERAFARLLGGRREIRHVGIVGGGIFPRTALIVRRLLPGARIVIIESEAEHIRRARPWIGKEVEVLHARYGPEFPIAFDLLVVPLAYRGDRKALRLRPPAPLLLLHDWIWRPMGRTAVISWLLLKRLNCLER